MSDPAAMGGATNEDLGAQVAAGQAAAGVGIGATEVNIQDLLKQINDYKAATDARIAQLEREKRTAAGVHPLDGTVRSLKDLITQHAAHTPGTDCTPVLNLVNDLSDAAGAAIESGDGQHTARIGAKVLRWLTRNPPPPGDTPYYRQALDFAGPHLEDAVDTLEPPASGAAALGSGKPPAKVVEGNVTAG